MTPLRAQLLKAACALPFIWLGATFFAGIVTWWHGYAIGFMLIMFLLTIIAVFWVSVGFGEKGITLHTFVFSLLFIVSCIAFNVYALVVLFFPQWKGWGNWNANGHWTNIYFQLPSDFNYITLLIFFALIFIYGGKKFFELDLDAMKKFAYSRKEVVNDHVYYLNTAHSEPGPSFRIFFKSKFLKKSEHWIHAGTVLFCCYIILPFGSVAGAVGSIAVSFGNNFFAATLFFICNYFFLCLSIYGLLQMYGRYCLIRELEKEMGVKLKPAIYDEAEK